MLQQAHRVLRRGGRLVVNVDATSHSEATGTLKRNLSFDVQRLAKRVGFTFLDDFVWFKQKTVGSKHRIAWGTPYDPTSPRIRRNHEYILVFCKESQFVAGEDTLVDTPDDVFEHATVSTWNYDAKNRQAAEETIDSFWYVSPAHRDGNHPCPFPEKLAEIVVQTWSRRGDVVIDPYNGSGTTTAVAMRLGRRWVGIDLSPEYCADAQQRLRAVQTEAPGEATCASANTTEADAIAALVNLGEKRSVAEALLGRARQVISTPVTTEALLREMLRIRGEGRGASPRRV